VRWSSILKQELNASVVHQLALKFHLGPSTLKVVFLSIIFVSDAFLAHTALFQFFNRRGCPCGVQVGFGGSFGARMVGGRMHLSPYLSY